MFFKLFKVVLYLFLLMVLPLEATEPGDEPPWRMGISWGYSLMSKKETPLWIKRLEIVESRQRADRLAFEVFIDYTRRITPWFSLGGESGVQLNSLWFFAPGYHGEDLGISFRAVTVYEWEPLYFDIYGGVKTSYIKSLRGSDIILSGEAGVKASLYGIYISLGLVMPFNQGEITAVPYGLSWGVGYILELQ